MTPRLNAAPALSDEELDDNRTIALLDVAQFSVAMQKVTMNGINHARVDLVLNLARKAFGLPTVDYARHVRQCRCQRP